MIRLALCLVVMAGLGGPVMAQSAGEITAARAVLAQLQGRSFAENREYCGYIGRLPGGGYGATDVTRGRVHSCLSRGSEARFVEVTASFHTHGGFDRSADSEVPSVNDVMGDMAERVDGYVATPGGRLWFIDWRSGTVRQLCGLGCMGQDPRFVAGASGYIAPSYSLRALQARESNW